MKIKRLTAGLAVAAMAATFFVAAPIVSAQAAPDYGATFNVNSGNSAIVDITVTVDKANGAVTPLDPLALLNQYATSTGTGWDGKDFLTYMLGRIYATANPINDVVHCGDLLAPPSLTLVKGTIPGNVYAQGPSCMYDATDVPAGTKVEFGYAAGANFNPSGGAAAATWPASWNGGTPPNIVNNYNAFTGIITVIVNDTTPAYSGCVNAKGSGVCLYADTQAYTAGDKDGAKAAKVSIATIKPNNRPAGTWWTPSITGFIDPSDTSVAWALIGWAVRATPGANSQLGVSDSFLNSLVSPDPKNPNNIVFTTPADWSGVIVYDYRLTAVDPKNPTQPMTVDYTNPYWVPGQLTITVHPTLGAIDDLYTDPSTAVTVPIVSKGAATMIYGTKPFQDANCVFSGTNGKTKLTSTGSIKNPGGSKDPIFTPVDGFVGDVTLSCTVADKYDPISNAVDVVIHVGTPAPTATTPAPAAPSVPACDKTDSAGKCIISVTGGSLAAPMSSGLAAVVLLVAAGAGILVVRRRTLLAG